MFFFSLFIREVHYRTGWIRGTNIFEFVNPTFWLILQINSQFYLFIQNSADSLGAVINYRPFSNRLCICFGNEPLAFWQCVRTCEQLKLILTTPQTLAFTENTALTYIQVLLLWFWFSWTIFRHEQCSLLLEEIFFRDFMPRKCTIRNVSTFSMDRSLNCWNYSSNGLFQLDVIEGRPFRCNELFFFLS